MNNILKSTSVHKNIATQNVTQKIITQPRIIEKQETLMIVR